MTQRRSIKRRAGIYEVYVSSATEMRPRYGDETMVLNLRVKYGSNSAVRDVLTFNGFGWKKVEAALTALLGAPPADGQKILAEDLRGRTAWAELDYRFAADQPERKQYGVVRWLPCGPTGDAEPCDTALA